MQKENQVCTLPQAKKLKDLGVIQTTSLIIHCQSTSMGLMTFFRVQEAMQETDYAAFTVGELGVMCRDCISGHCANTRNRGKYYATPDEYAGYDIDTLIGEVLPMPDPLPCYCEGKTQAIALADLLIWLLETKGITPEEVNDRLAAA